MNTFEDQLTGGFATYIHSYTCDLDSSSFEMTVFHDPDSPRDFRILRATGIEFYDDLPHGLGESDLIENIIGATQAPVQAGKILISIHTDIREFTILCSHVTLEAIPPDKP